MARTGRPKMLNEPARAQLMVPKSLYSLAFNAAEEQGVSFSELTRHALIDRLTRLGYTIPEDAYEIS